MSPRTPRPLPDALSRYAFRTKNAFELGVTPGELQRLEVSTISRGIRAVRQHDALEFAEYLEVAASVVGETQNGVASHVTAAMLLDIPLPWRLPSVEKVISGHRVRCLVKNVIHVTVPAGQRTPRRREALGYCKALQHSEIVDVFGIPTTSLPRTMLDLTQWLGDHSLVVALDSLFSDGARSPNHSKVARLTRQEMQAYLKSKSGQRGIKRLRFAMDRAVTGADSPPETELRLALEEADLPPFLANVPILDETGYPVIWPDLSNAEFQVCIEYEGAVHLTAEQLHSDTNRDLRVQMRGWLQVRITKLDMQNPQFAVLKVRSALIRRGWTPN